MGLANSFAPPMHPIRQRESKGVGQISEPLRLITEISPKTSILSPSPEAGAVSGFHRKADEAYNRMAFQTYSCGHGESHQ